jgi:hypothetical protein
VSVRVSSEVAALWSIDRKVKHSTAWVTVQRVATEKSARNEFNYACFSSQNGDSVRLRNPDGKTEEFSFVGPKT